MSTPIILTLIIGVQQHVSSFPSVTNVTTLTNVSWFFSSLLVYVAIPFWNCCGGKVKSPHIQDCI